ncbi:MAG: LysM peptidoglycan-binding domain-containing protein [Proteobacteria bacterium]|nr:LysM peptidoglycan-binding domain-containing protein [Pseudomonadota bacterium]
MNTTTVTTIENLLALGRVVEAKTLLISQPPCQSGPEQGDWAAEIEQRLAQAEALVTQAAAMEHDGKINEAKMVYESVLELAVDFPHIDEHISRMDEALQLTRAVQRRSKRVRHSQSTGTGKVDTKKPRIIWAILGTGVAAVVLLLAVTTPWAPGPGPEKKQRETTPLLIVAPPAESAPSTPPELRDSKPSPAKDQLPEPPKEQPKPQPSSAAPDTPLAQDPLPSQVKLPPSAPDALNPPPAPVPEHPTPAAPQAPVATPISTQPMEIVYTVQRSDSLSSIARNELCNALAWQQIYQRNRDLIADPDLVLAGMVLRLTGLENRCPQARQPASPAGRPTPAKKGKEEKVSH